LGAEDFSKKVPAGCRFANGPIDAYVTGGNSPDNQTAKEPAMRFMTLIKGPEHAGPPPQALMEAIGQLGAEAVRAGVMVETGGLGPSAGGARIEITGTGTKVIDGPFSESKELIGGYAVYEVESKEEALDWCHRFAELHTKHWPGWVGEVELREVVFRQ
jgi:hypothetical protein